MPNDTLDEIEARWGKLPRAGSSLMALALADLGATIEMVRARDAEIEQLRQIIDCLEWLKAKHDAALDTPQAQEQKP